MARIQITLPEIFIFTTELTIRASDLNYGAHVGNDSILTLMQEARIVYYRSLGFKDEISFEANVGQIIADAAIQYKSEAFLGDHLTIKIAVDEFSRFGFDMFYLLENAETGKEVARGKTGIVCFDYEKRKIAAIPEILLHKLKQ
jgi:YbgC/YbaW family acyl-CoA thioester hydrolase